MGPYPLFSCLDPSQLAADVEDLGGALVAVSLVLDPFGDWPLPALEGYFVDCFRPFKAHFVTDLAVPADPVDPCASPPQCGPGAAVRRGRCGG